MTKRNTNRLLAGVLTLVMVFSLCQVSLGQSAQVKAATTLQNPTMDGVVSTWDCIYFGNYYQNSTTFKVPIKWRVLSVEGDDAFLLADKNLDVQPYNEEYAAVTWETCTLRKWLNGTFLDTAFTAEEQAAIKDITVVNDDNPAYGTEGGADTIDKVYLLSIAEASNPAYGFYHLFQLEASDTRVVKNTLLVADKVKTDTGSEPTNWWLRSPGTNIGHCAADVHHNGDGCEFGEAVYFELRVRPVLHLNLSETALWQYAGKVSSNGDVEEPTPTVVPTSTPTAVPTVIPTATTVPTVAPTATPTAVPTATIVPTATAAVTAPPATATPTPTIVPTATAAPSLSTGDTTPGVSNNDSNISKNSDNNLLSKVVLKTPKNKKGKKIVASWSAVKGAKGYQVQYAASRNFKKKSSVSIKKTTYTIKKLKKNKVYYVRVRAYDTNGTKKTYGAWSKIRKVKVKK